MHAFYKAIGHLADGRVYPQYLPEQSDYPAVVYQLISQTHMLCLDGFQNLARRRMQVSIYALTYQQTYDIYNQINQALQHAAFALASIQLNVSEFEHTRQLHRLVADYLYYC